MEKEITMSSRTATNFLIHFPPPTDCPPDNLSKEYHNRAADRRKRDDPETQNGERRKMRQLCPEERADGERHERLDEKPRLKLPVEDVADAAADGDRYNNHHRRPDRL